MRRRFLPTVTTVAAVTGVAAFALVSSAPAGNAAARPSSAYAVSAVGQVPIPRTPYVESGDGRRRSSSALEVPTNPLIAVRAGTVTAGNDSAAVELLDVTLLKGALDQIKLPPELRKSCANLPATGADELPVPDLKLPELGLPLPELGTKDLPVKNLPELCDLLLTPPNSLLGIDSINVWCKGDKGGIDIGEITLLGQKLDLPALDQKTTIPAAPLATIGANRQTKRSDGSFTITGLEINLGGGTEVIQLASATCATPAAKPKPKPKPVPLPELPPDDADAPPVGPVPTPVKTRHPVTG